MSKATALRSLALAALLLAPAPALAVDTLDAAAAQGPNPCAGANLTKGQRRIDQGRYADAVAIYTCILAGDPTVLDAYRGRAEASLRLGLFSDAMRDHARITAVVLPAQPDAIDTLFADYDARLSRHPDDVAALTGAIFVHWWNFDYGATLPLLDQLLALRPNDLFGTLYRGSNRLFVGEDVAGGMADFEAAIALAPSSAHVRFIVADGYTYAYPDPSRALSEANLALAWGLDTPRVHAILASSSFALGDVASGAYHVQQHIEQVTTAVASVPALGAGQSAALDLTPGTTFELPITVTAGEPVSIRTDSPSGAIYDSIVVLVAPDGSPAIGNDDFIDYFAGFDWVAPTAGTFVLRVTSFEGVSTGDLLVSRD